MNQETGEKPMLAKTFVTVVVAVGFGLLGWGAAQLQKTKIPHQKLPCKTTASSCNIKVLVETNCFFCDVYVDYELTEVTVAQDKKGNKITWDIADARYEFAQDGIMFPADSGITCQAQNKQKFVCDNLSKAGVYKYTVKVKNFDPLDPWVVNN
jgi:hypothetical protein